MEQYQLLIIYFKFGQKSKKLSFWQKLWNSSLSNQLLKAAKVEKTVKLTTQFQFKLTTCFG